MTRVGFSLFLGLMVGLIFRTFLRIATLLCALTIAAAAALSYFHIVNVDMTAVQQGTTQATSWLTDQTFRLAHLLFGALPATMSTGSAGAGFFIGFKRR